MKYLLVLACVILSISALDKKSRRSFLRTHNKLRAKHGVGRLRWSKDHAEFAQGWCDHLAETRTFEHSEGNSYGENLYRGWGTPEKAVNRWYNEVDLYDWENPGWQYDAGHFTIHPGQWHGYT